MFVMIRGGGDIATGVALRLWRSGMDVCLCEIPAPTAIRRTVCFSEAVRRGETTVENVTARLCEVEEVPDLEAGEEIAVTFDGMIRESYPAQITATRVERLRYELGED